MKYSFTINQKAIIDSGFKLDINDACIMTFLNSFALSPRIEKKFVGNKVYCWFQYANIVTNLPLLDLKKDAVYRRLKNMADIGLLEAHPDNQLCGKAFFHLTELFFNMFFDADVPTVENPNPYGSKTVPPTVSKPDYNSINDYKPLSNDKGNIAQPDLFGGDIPKKSRKKQKINLRESVDFDLNILLLKFKGTQYEEADANINYYYECALAWSDNGNLAVDWYATIRNFMLRDIKLNSLVTNATAKSKLKGVKDMIQNWDSI